MSITLTVDLGTSSPSDIAKAAKFMLEYAGYQSAPPPPVAQAPLPEKVLTPAQRAPQQADPQDPGHGHYLQPIWSPKLAELFERAPSIAYDDPPGSEPLFTHGTRELDMDAAKLEAMGGDAGPVFVVPPPPQAPGIDVDMQGLPWDVRIHSASRAKVADGTWRQRRNLDPAVLTEVMAQLRATMGVERRAPVPPVPPVPAAVFADVSHMQGVPPPPFAPSVVAPAVPVIPASPPAPPATSAAGAAPIASPSSLPVTFPRLMQWITLQFTQKAITQADISAAVQKAGLASLPLLASRPDLVADVATNLGASL